MQAILYFLKEINSLAQINNSILLVYTTLGKVSF